MNKLSIAFANNLVIIPIHDNGDTKNTALAMSVQAELMNVGFMLSKEAFSYLETRTESFIASFHNGIIPLAKSAKGVTGQKYSPLWKNFPIDVMAASDAELYITALIHYWTNGTWSPDAELKARGFAFEKKNFIELKLAPENWEQILVNDLAAFTKPLDPTSLKNLVWLAQNCQVTIPEVSVKETMAALAVAGIPVKVKSPVDVLRIAVGMSGGDMALPSMPKIPQMKVKSLMSRGYSYTFNQKVAEANALRETFKFKKFTRSERRYILGLLESLKSVDEAEMQRHLGRWIRLGEVLHPGEMKSKFPKAAAAFSKIRNQEEVKVRTFAGRVDLAFKQSPDAGMQVLQERPGEFARRLDALVRNEKYDAQQVIDRFAQVAGKVSTKVLFEMFDHFEGRLKDKPRMVMIKGKGSKVKNLETLPKLPDQIVENIQKMIKQQLADRAAKLPAMGNVFVDDQLLNMPVPYSMQSSAEGTSTLVRGTRIPIAEGANTLRGFVHWYDENGDHDIDLSATFLGAKFEILGECAFYDLRSTNLKAYHSGDVRHRIGHNAEYIDFDLNSAKEHGVKYVVFSAYNYNGNAIKSVPECTFGVMERSKPKSNEIFDPATAPQAIKVQANSNSVFPVMIDVEAHEWIWLDLESDGRGFASFHSNSSTLDKIKAFTQQAKFSVYDLISLHVGSRSGTIVSKMEDADLIYSYDDIVRNYSKLTEFLNI